MSVVPSAAPPPSPNTAILAATRQGCLAADPASQLEVKGSLLLLAPSHHAAGPRSRALHRAGVMPRRDRGIHLANASDNSQMMM